MVAALAIMAALWVFFIFTMIGKALRATSQNPRAAALVGIPVRRMSMTAWGIAASLAGIAGILLAPNFCSRPIWRDRHFGACCGDHRRLCQLPGCVVGGVALGIAQNLIGVYISSRAISLAPFLVIMIVLLVRPQGLFAGSVRAKKV